MKNLPPKYFHKFFLWFCRRDLRYHIEGDLLEMFQRNSQEKGLGAARRIFRLEVLKLLRPEIIQFFHTHKKLKINNMTTHHFRIAVRRLFRNGKSSLASIFGITVGLTATILMLFYIQYETTYDHFHDDHKRMFMVERIYQNSRISEIYDSNPYPLAQALSEQIPEIEKAFNVSRTAEYFEYDGQFYRERNGLFADNEFLETFQFRFTEGNKSNALSAPMSMVISESISKKLDPYGRVIGKTIRINKNHDFTITGVFEDYAENSHLNVDYILSYESFKALKDFNPYNDWKSRFSNSTYIKLTEFSDPFAVDLKIKDFLKNYSDKDQGFEEYLSLRPVTDIYLHTGKVKGGIGKRSEITLIYLFLGVVIFTIVITALNFINSTTAQTMSREPEMGIKKVMGSSRLDLVMQFFAESAVLIIVALFFALLLSAMLLPTFGDTLYRSLEFDFTRDWKFLLQVIGGSFLVGILAGFYPIILLAKLKLSSFLHGVSSLHRKSKLRKFLVVFQLLVTIPLIFTAFVISEQINFLQTKDLGFNKYNLLRAPVKTGAINEEKINYIKETLAKNNDIISTSFSKTAPFHSGNALDVSLTEFPKEKFRLRTHYIDPDFIDTYEMEIIEGRQFSKDLSTDKTDGIIINQATQRLFGWENAIGKTFNNGELKVIGVVKDFNDYTLFKKIRPMAMRMYQTTDDQLFVTIRVKGNNHFETQKYVNNLFNEEFPSEPIQFQYLESNFDIGFIASLESVNKMFIFFSLLAVLMTGIGLYSLVALSARMQQKMIAIRKVLGAGAKDLFLMMLKEYLILYIIATSIGLIASYLISATAFNVLPYHVSIGPEHLVIPGIIAFLLVFISVVHKITTTVRSNPVDAIAKE
ncbi:MAG: ABC transporter permease [Bacteroidota bacterium]